MQHPIGRHRKPHRSMTARLWALVAAALAMALSYVFVPEYPQRERAAITPPPRTRELPPTPASESAPAQDHHTHDDPDRIAGALVRPYMVSATTSPRVPAVPVPRVPEGDLLAAPAGNGADDLGDLATAVRRYLHRAG